MIANSYTDLLTYSRSHPQTISTFFAQKTVPGDVYQETPDLLAFLLYGECDLQVCKTGCNQIYKDFSNPAQELFAEGNFAVDHLAVRTLSCKDILP